MFKKTKKIQFFLSPSDKSLPKENTPPTTKGKTIFWYSDTK